MEIPTVTISAIDGDHHSIGTELDSHADSAVVGKNALVLRHTNKSVTVSGFTKSLGNVKSVPIVDAAIMYECPYNHHCYCLTLHNALLVPALEHNLIPPFLLRRAGVHVNDEAKILVKAPTEEHHSLYFPDNKLRIPLSLKGIVSYFPTRKPTIDEWLQHPNLDITPDEPSWNPSTTEYSSQEALMLDHEGHMMLKDVRDKHLVELRTREDYDDPMEFTYLAVESSAIEMVMATTHCTGTNRCSNDMGLFMYDENTEDTIAAVLNDISPALHPLSFSNRLNERQAVGQFGMSVGAVNIDCDDDGIEPLNDGWQPDHSEILDYSILSHELLEHAISALSTSIANGISASRLAEVFRISEKMAEKTLKVTTQRLR